MVHHLHSSSLNNKEPPVLIRANTKEMDLRTEWNSLIHNNLEIITQ